MSQKHTMGIAKTRSSVRSLSDIIELRSSRENCGLKSCLSMLTRLSRLAVKWKRAFELTGISEVLINCEIEAPNSFELSGQGQDYTISKTHASLVRYSERLARQFVFNGMYQF